MKRILIAAVFAFAPAALAQDGFTQLFNGKDFTGWKIGGNQTTFTVKDGAIVANGAPAHCFYDGPVMNHNFKNFELMVDVMTLPKSNGGIYFHTEYQPAGWPSKGFEVQVNVTHSDPIKSASLYHVLDIGADIIDPIIKDGEWFTEHIIVQGKTVTVKLNGKQVVQWTQPADWNGGREGPGRTIGAGSTFALQGHDPGSTVQYKNIRVKALP